MRRLEWQSIVFAGLVLCLAVPQTGFSQCLYLAYEGFNYPAGTALHAQFGGTGFQESWDVQGGSATPGYQAAGTASLSYHALRGTGNHAIGGRGFFVSGRRLDTASNSLFAPYLTNGSIGATGQTLWLSAILQKDGNNDEPVTADLHNDNVPYYWFTPNPKVGFGYYQGYSDRNGVKYWTLRINSTLYLTDVPIVLGQATFLVLGITFDPTNGHTIRLYVNPDASTLGASTPPTPTLTQTYQGTMAFRSLDLYLGNTQNNAKADEIRMANSWACVTPTPDVAINEPPTAAISATPSSGTSPLTVSFDGTQSFDPEAPLANYEWAYGDGTPKETAPTVTHTFTHLGKHHVRLTVTDQTGLKHTAYHTITVRDENNNLPCFASISLPQRPTCGQSDGRVLVTYGNGNTIVFQNATGQILSPGSTTWEGLVYHNLAPGSYHASVSSSTNGCASTFNVTVTEDPSTCAGWSPNACDMSVGMNLDEVVYWGADQAFRDYAKGAGRWVTSNLVGPSPWDDGAWDTGVLSEMPVDENGYPTVLPFTSSKGLQKVRYILSTLGRMPPDTDYVLLYDGTGTLVFPGGYGFENVVYAPNRIRFRIKSGYQDNVFLHITASQQGDHIRNIRIYKTNEEASTNTFNAAFLDRIRPFKALRFLNWSGANVARPLNAWSERTKPQHYTQDAAFAPSGVAFEHIVELANLLDKDIWLTVPHLTSDAFVSEMAAFFRDHLEPERTIYLEYSNEVWNTVFSQTTWVDQNGPANLNFPRKYAERAVHLFDIWHSVFGGQKHRVKRVLNVQISNPWASREIMSHLPSDRYDMVSPAWYFYFGGNCEQTLNTLGASATAADVLNCARAYYNSELPNIRGHYWNASLFGKEVVNYEGGQHITGMGVQRSFQSAIYATQIDPAIYTLYQDVMTDLRKMGSRLAMAFTLASTRVNKYGSWGHLEHVSQQPPYHLSAPKYQALLDQISQCSANTLPISLVGFSGQVIKNKEVKLVWHTASEIGEEGFFVEQEAQDPSGKMTWKTIGYVKAKGFSNELNTYQHLVTSVRYGKNKFRLRSISLNGTASISNALEIWVQLPADKPLVFHAPYPNPFNRQATLAFAAPNGIATRLEVFDLLGRSMGVLQSRIGTGEEETFVWQPQGLPAGVYFLRLTDEAGRQQLQRVVKVD